jgi:hypothetical protein
MSGSFNRRIPGGELTRAHPCEIELDTWLHVFTSGSMQGHSVWLCLHALAHVLCLVACMMLMSLLPGYGDLTTLKDTS